MNKLFFLVSVDLPDATTPERVEMLRSEIQEHAAAVVPFYTHQQPNLAACLHITTPNDINIIVAMSNER